MSKSSSYASQIIVGTELVPLTESDDEFVDGTCRALWIGEAGYVNITTSNGTDLDDVPVQAGLFPLKCNKLRSGASTPAASNIYAIY
jgi:hypothetical protein